MYSCKNVLTFFGTVWNVHYIDDIHYLVQKQKPALSNIVHVYIQDMDLFLYINILIFTNLNALWNRLN